MSYSCSERQPGTDMAPWGFSLPLPDTTSFRTKQFLKKQRLLSNSVPLVEEMAPTCFFPGPSYDIGHELTRNRRRHHIIQQKILLCDPFVSKETRKSKKVWPFLFDINIKNCESTSILLLNQKHKLSLKFCLEIHLPPCTILIYKVIVSYGIQSELGNSGASLRTLKIQLIRGTDTFLSLAIQPMKHSQS